MTVSTSANQSIMLGNGVTTAFSWNFNSGVPTGQSTSEASYTVIYTSPAGVETTLTASTYSLTFTPAAAGTLWGVGGILTYPLTGSPIASGSTLTLIRTFPLTQTTTISNQGDFSPQVIEEMGDTLEMQIQQVNNRTTQWRGTWLSGVAYNPGDIVQDGSHGAGTNNYYLCLVGNTSGTWSTDLGNGDWTLSVQALLPTSNQPITLSGAVTGTGSTNIATSFGTLAATSFLANVGTATNVLAAFPLTSGTLAGMGSTGGLAAISPNTGLAISGTNLNNTGVVVVATQRFTSSATYTPTSGMLYCDVQLWGGGGGGGGTSGANQASGGGGAGGYSRALFSAATIGSGKAVVIGAFGAGGSNSGGTGGHGGTSTFANVMICIGGIGGTNAGTGGAGGVASGGDINIAGQVGGWGNPLSTSYSAGGNGGSTSLGGNGGGLVSVGSTPLASNAITNSGSGGSGAGGGGSASALAGGQGGSGFCLITEYCT